MEENVKKELETLRGMVLRWKDSYLGFASPEGGDEYLVEEFSEELHMHIYHYTRRLYQNDHLTYVEYEEFMEFCYAQVDDLRKAIRESEDKETKGFWNMLAGK